MNRIVREHYPVEKLPDDLQEGFHGLSSVRVVIEPETPAMPDEELPLARILEEASRLRREGKIKAISSEEAVARVRAIRDGWGE